MCESGFCVIAGCPAICTSCNEAAHTCNVDCTSAATCGTVDCPSGWSCDITCTGTGACGNITCETGSTCVVACTDPSACGAVACSAACKCDLTCASGGCGSYSCPTFNNGPKGHCTTDGTAGMVCRSTQNAACVKC